MSPVFRIFARADRFTIGIIISVVLGLLLPCTGTAAELFDVLTNTAIVLLFYLYGVKLSRESVVAGLLNWRLPAINSSEQHCLHGRGGRKRAGCGMLGLRIQLAWRVSRPPAGRPALYRCE